jgi:serine/threonine kinase 16
MMDYHRKNNSRISTKLLRQLFLDTCSGLKAFHSHVPPFAFRDLKPANIIIDDQGRGCLIDLGSVSVARLNITDRKEVSQ